MNAADGVDDCAVGNYCIDTISVPSRCTDLTSATACFVGREFET